MTTNDIIHSNELALTMEQILSPVTRRRLSIDSMGVTSTDPSDQAAGRRAQAILSLTQYPDSDSVRYCMIELRGEHDVPECPSGESHLLAFGLLD